MLPMPLPPVVAPLIKAASDVAVVAASTAPVWVVWLDGGNKIVAFLGGIGGLILLGLRIDKAWRGRKAPITDEG